MSFFDRVLPTEEPPIRLWNHDPELFEALDAQAQREARLQAVAPALRLDVGPWSGRLTPEVDTSHHLGLLLVEGLLVRTVTVAGNARSEVIGPGDLIRPWDDEDDVPTTPTDSHWDVIEPVRLAVLDEGFLTTVCRWPPVASALMGRTIRRSRWLGQQLAITDLRRIDDRLLLLFWHLADRWGQVRGDGVLVPLRVTHDMLAQLVGAQRPTVTSGLQRLTRAGKLRRLADKTWLLPHVVDPPERASTDSGPAPAAA